MPYLNELLRSLLRLAHLSGWRLTETPASYSLQEGIATPQTRALPRLRRTSCCGRCCVLRTPCMEAPQRLSGPDGLRPPSAASPPPPAMPSYTAISLPRCGCVRRGWMPPLRAPPQRSG